jgi:hypothetical protein
MQLLYNSDSYVVVQFDVPAPASTSTAPADVGEPALSRGGFEIVDKFARKEIFIEGALAERFKQGVQTLVEAGPTEDQLDEFIATFTEAAQQPVVLH